MNSYWVKFTNGTAGCVDAESEEAALRWAGESIASSAKILPYPAVPRLKVEVNCPAFCYDPENCCGRTSCPKRYACSE